MWKNRRVLVTGATGMLGSHMVEKLLDDGADVTVIIRDYLASTLYLSLTNECNETSGDITDFAFVSRVINEYQIQTVFHLAAQTQVSIANRNPIPTFESNIKGTWNVLDACRINNVEQVVIASSDKAYGASPTLPYDEDTPLRGIHPYDVSKSCADMIAQAYRQTYHMNVGITRCGNLFGAGDLNFNRIVPGTIRSLLNNERPVIRSDGKMTRDYFYVKDAVGAYLTLAEYLLANPNYTSIFNFSYGKPLSVLDMVEEIRDAMGSTILDPIILNEATNEIREQYLDSSKARMLLNWKPQWTIHEALKETIAWYKETLS